MSRVVIPRDTTKRKRTPLKRILIFFIFLEVAGFLTAIGFFIAAMIAGIDGFDLASIGGSIFFGVTGSSMALMIISVVISNIRRKNAYSSDRIAREFGYENNYTTKNYPDEVKPSKKQVYYCSYCGYGADSLIGECPKCGGPIKEGTK